jgi:hypothetical protein
MAATAPVLTMAKNTIPKGMAPMESLLNDLMEKEFITQDTYDRIKADEDLAHYFAPPKRKGKGGTKAKSSPKKAKTSSTKQEKQDEDFDEDRCSARKWESDGGLGYDNIQCSSCKKIPKEDAEDILNEFKGKMNEAQLENMEDYLEKYDGCFCKNHLKQDFFMPNGWWLGKVNEDRPEKPMLPKGSFKDGYQDDYKEHQWMYVDGNKVEKQSGRRGRGCCKKKVEENVEEEVEENVEEEVEEPIPEDDGAGTGLKPVQNETVDVEEVEVEVKEEESKDDQPYIVDGVEYTKVWDEEDEEWLLTYDDEHIGWPKDEDSINFADEDEEKKHKDRVEAL